MYAMLCCFWWRSKFDDVLLLRTKDRGRRLLFGSWLTPVTSCSKEIGRVKYSGVAELELDRWDR